MLRHNTAELMGMPNSNGIINIGSNKTNNSNISKGTTNVSNSNNINNSINTSGSPLDALPKQFVASMKTLFDILDDQHRGFIKFVDIEKGWKDDGCKELPRGVIDSLRKVTPTSGLLSFERFCAGLKLCLLKNQNETATITTKPTTTIMTNLLSAGRGGLKCKASVPSSASILEIENQLPNVIWNSSPTSTFRPHKISATSRALSLQHLSQDSETDVDVIGADVSVYQSPPPPPKPPRAAATLSAAPNNGILKTVRNTTTAKTTPALQVPHLDKAEIRSALQNWQMGILLNEMDAKDKPKLPYLYNQQFQYRGCADGGSSSTTDSINGTIALHAKKNNSKRREPRRHTLQNGIDYNMLKRLKQFEEEREVLLLGLEAVEKARVWYVQQVSNVQEKIKYLGRMGHMEQISEVQQERLNFQRARVYEVNRNLETLVDSWEHGGFPLHFNLAIRTPNKKTMQRSIALAGSETILKTQPADRLRQQNRHLIDEVNLKSDRIAMLESEKQALMRELFELQQRMGLNGAGRVPGFVNVLLSQSSPVCSSSSGGLGDADVVY